MDGQLASVARALRDGFLAAHLHAQQSGQALRIELYDSTRMTSIDEFYRQAQDAGVQLVVGPPEQDMVRQLAEREQRHNQTPHMTTGDARTGEEGGWNWRSSRH